MNTAICFSGQARNVEYTYKNINENLISSFENCDTFFHIAEDESSQNLLKYFNPTSYKIEKDIPIDEKDYIFWQGIRGTKQQYLQMVLSKRKSNDLRKDYEQKTGKKYDLVIHSRLDVQYFQKISDFKIEQYDREFLYIPDFHCFNFVLGGGYNDRFAFSNSENMDVYFSLNDHLKGYCKQGIPVHAESSLFYHLNNFNVKVKHCPIRFTRVRNGGEKIDMRISKEPNEWKYEDRV